jgi:uncharacterized membrane protein
MAWQDNGTVVRRWLSGIIHMMLIYGCLDDLYLILAQIVRISAIDNLSKESRCLENIQHKNNYSN